MAITKRLRIGTDAIIKAFDEVNSIVYAVFHATTGLAVPLKASIFLMTFNRCVFRIVTNRKGHTAYILF